MNNNELLKLDNQLCFALYSSSRFMTRAYAPLLDKFNLTYPQYLVLLVLWEQDNITVNQIGEKLYLDSGTLTPLLKRLQQADIVERKRSEEDERKVIITLTAKGVDMKKEATEIPIAMFKKMHISMEELKNLKFQLEQLIEAYKEA